MKDHVQDHPQGASCHLPAGKQHQAHAGHDGHGAHGHGSGGVLGISAYATLHCLIGCVIGETIGLAVGVHFGIGMWPTMLLATVLAYIAGFSLAVPPIMRKQKMTFSQAFRAIWLGEAISIGVMEIVMNGVDYMVGGVQAASLTSPVFYIGLAAAVPAGFLAGWPVNYLLLGKEIKAKCH